MNTEVNEEEEIKDSPQNEEEQKDDQNSDKNSTDSNKDLAKLTKENIADLSEQLGSDWKKLATELNFPEDDIEYFAAEGDEKEQAVKMLTVWQVSSSSFSPNPCLH